MEVKEIIKKLVSKNDLTGQEVFAFMEDVAQEKVTSAQIGAFLTALAMKGETAEEIFSLSQFLSLIHI